MESSKSQTFENFPVELREIPQWICYQSVYDEANKRYDKKPKNSKTGGNAMPNNPDTWATYPDAKAAFERSEQLDGLGFVMNNNGIVGIDLDHVVDTASGEISPEALEIVERLNSYSEFSPSGTGLHIFVYGDIPADGRNNRKRGIEMYKAKHYLTVTGNVFGAVRALAHRESEVLKLYAEVFPVAEQPSALTIPAESVGQDHLSVGLEKDSSLLSLWNGDRPNGNESSDDMALMNKLAYWCNRDVDQMIVAFLRSPHCQQKDALHVKKVGRKDYLQRTAKKAASECERSALQDREKFRLRTAQEDFSVVIGNDGAEKIIAAVAASTSDNLNTLLSDDVLDALFSIDDEIKRQREIAKLKPIAKEHGFAREFDSLIRARKEAESKKKSQAPSDGPEKIVLKDCPIQGLKTPGNWNVTSHGVFRNVEGEVQTACPHPIIITDRLQNVDDRIEKLNLAFYRDKSWKAVPVSRSTAGSRTAIVSLADTGIQVNSENAKFLVPYLEALETANSDIIPRRQSLGRLGWVNGSDFFPYSKNYVFDGGEEYLDMFESVSEQGNYGEWVSKVGAARQNSLMVRAILSASFSAPLLWPLNKLCYCVHLWGHSGTAKTVALYAAMSIWGEPAHLTQSFNGTDVGLERCAAFCHSIPLAMDERETAKNDKYNAFDQVIYRLMEGKGRNRGKKNGGMQKVDHWRLPVLTNGESPLIAENSKAGAKNRVLEFYCDKELFEDSPGMASLVKENYGTAGRKWIEALEEEQNRDKFSGINDFYKAFFDTLDKEHQHTDKQLTSLTMIVLADYFSSMWIFGIEPAAALEQAQALGKGLLGMLATKAEMDVTDAAWEWTKSWVAQNKINFTSGFGVERFGEVISADVIFVMGKVFTTALTEAGHNPIACRRSFLERGYLIPSQSKDPLQGRYTINGVQVRGYRLRIENSWKDNLDT